MPEKFIRLIILVLGYLTLSHFNFTEVKSVNRGIGTFLLMMIIYRVPTRMDIDFLFWLKGSVIVSIFVMFINIGTRDELTVFLLFVFCAFGINKRFFQN